MTISGTNIRGTLGAGLPVAGGPTPTNLREAAQEFESLLIAQMLDAMRRTAPKGGLLGTSDGETMFRELMDREVARRMAASGGFGIGDLIYRQLGGDQQPEP